mmetsp:Transcript_90350/g.135455  ORF Transcript_90350/g.135455 Transcript_90350/m.135455 type:complete len:80 (-) Transcript_90350:110-349(-)
MFKEIFYLLIISVIHHLRKYPFLLLRSFGHKLCMKALTIPDKPVGSKVAKIPTIAYAHFILAPSSPLVSAEIKGHAFVI